MMTDLLEKLVKAYGPSANEKAVVGIIEDEIGSFIDEMKVDALGNLIAVRKGGKRKIWLSAPMDQGCLLINHVEKQGEIKFAPMGITDPYSLLNSRVVFENGMQGVVVIDKTVDSVTRMEDFYIDIGAKSDGEVKKMLPIGAAAIVKGEYYEKYPTVIAPALASRAACMCLVDIIKSWPKSSKHEAYFVFSCQSLLGARGAIVASRSVEPELAISIDAISSEKNQIRPGQGPVVRLRDKSIACHPDLVKAFEATAQKLDIPLQRKIPMQEISDVSGISQASSDVPVVSLGFAVKNRHTASEIINLDDINKLTKLILNHFEG